MAKPIGILGGTFDPVHFGHLRLAMEVQQQLALEHVRLIPLHTPRHRSVPVASPEHRLQMLSIAVEGVPGLQVDTREINRGGVSYTVDTIRELRQELGAQPLCLIMGADAFAGLHDWHEWEKILDYVHIIVVRRPGAETVPRDPMVAALRDSCLAQDHTEIHNRSAGLIAMLNAPLLEISSSRIRELFKQKKNVSYLLPGGVITYIYAQVLYQAAE